MGIVPKVIRGTGVYLRRDGRLVVITNAVPDAWFALDAHGGRYSQDTGKHAPVVAHMYRSDHDIISDDPVGIARSLDMLQQYEEAATRLASLLRPLSNVVSIIEALQHAGDGGRV